MDALRGVLRELPPRRAYCPGAEGRRKQFISAYGKREAIGEKVDGVLPWTLLPDLDARTKDNLAFRTESFCCVMAQTNLPGDGAAEFLVNAVHFANEVLWGTLNAGIIIDPETQRSIGPSFEQAIAELRCGTIATNAWPAFAFALGKTPWGAHPGRTLDDIQSGIGVVHNTRLFDKPEKEVIHAPFRVEPKAL